MTTKLIIVGLLAMSNLHAQLHFDPDGHPYQENYFKFHVGDPQVMGPDRRYYKIPNPYRKMIDYYDSLVEKMQQNPMYDKMPMMLLQKIEA